MTQAIRHYADLLDIQADVIDINGIEATSAAIARIWAEAEEMGHGDELRAEMRRRERRASLAAVAARR